MVKASCLAEEAPPKQDSSPTDQQHVCHNVVNNSSGEGKWPHSSRSRSIIVGSACGMEPSFIYKCPSWSLKGSIVTNKKNTKTVPRSSSLYHKREMRKPTIKVISFFFDFELLLIYMFHTEDYICAVGMYFF